MSLSLLVGTIVPISRMTSRICNAYQNIISWPIYCLTSKILPHFTEKDVLCQLHVCFSRTSPGAYVVPVGMTVNFGSM